MLVFMIIGVVLWSWEAADRISIIKHTLGITKVQLLSLSKCSWHCQKIVFNFQSCDNSPQGPHCVMQEGRFGCLTLLFSTLTDTMSLKPCKYQVTWCCGESQTGLFPFQEEMEPAFNRNVSKYWKNRWGQKYFCVYFQEIESCGVGIMAQWAKLQPTVLASHIAGQIQVSAALLLILLLHNAPGNEAEDSTKPLATAIQVGDLEGARGMWIWPGPHPVMAAL